MLFLVLGAIVWMARGRIDLPDDAREMLPLVLVVSVYLLYLVITASIVAFAAIDVRFLSPVFVPLIVLAAWTLERAYQQVPYRAGRAVIVGVALAWLVADTLIFGQAVSDGRERTAPAATRLLGGTSRS